jgi:hypothetical protein
MKVISIFDWPVNSLRSSALWILRNTTRWLPILFIALVVTFLAQFTLTHLKIVDRSVFAISASSKKGTVAVRPAPPSSAEAPTRNENSASTAEQTTGPGTEAQRLTASELDRYIRDFQWLMTLIISATGLFTIAQGAATHFTAQNFLRHAESELNATMKNLKENYSFLPQYQSLFEEARKQLNSKSWITAVRADSQEAFHWKRNLYREMPLEKRQLLITLNRVLPYVLRKDVELKEYVQTLRSLALLFWSKFIYETERGSACLDDLEHAEYLIDQAEQRAGETYELLNDRANINLEYYDAIKAMLQDRNGGKPVRETAIMREIAEKARKMLHTSIKKRPNQIRAYYDLSLLEADTVVTPPGCSSRLEIAIVEMRKAVSHTNWEEVPILEFSCHAHYNLACYLSRSMGGYDPRNKALRAECILELKKAAAIGMLDQETVNRDFSKGGDFENLIFSRPQPGDPVWESIRSALVTPFPARHLPKKSLFQRAGLKLSRN